MSSTRIDANKHLPVLCSIVRFTDKSVVIIPCDSLPAGEPALPRSITYLQMISDEYGAVRISDPVLASELDDSTMADLWYVQYLIAWIPQWKCQGLGLTAMGPKLEPSTENPSS